jgi:hypothetical protein
VLLKWNYHVLVETMVWFSRTLTLRIDLSPEPQKQSSNDYLDVDH